MQAILTPPHSKGTSTYKIRPLQGKGKLVRAFQVQLYLTPLVFILIKFGKMRGFWGTWNRNDFFQKINRYVLIAEGWVGGHLGLVLLRELGPRRAWRLTIMIFDSNVVGASVPKSVFKTHRSTSKECDTTLLRVWPPRRSSSSGDRMATQNTPKDCVGTGIS